MNAAQFSVHLTNLAGLYGLNS